MTIIAVLLVSLGLVLSPVIGFVYPYWREIQGEEDLSEKQLFGVRALGIGVLLLTVIIGQFLLQL
ncbi:hypothetical protein [Metabacillus sp. 84]|uniref:hypothetical protein n=1 Tax=unclassified Metabacillus TaxID=2675274 RepID=UPI003CEF1071